MLYLPLLLVFPVVSLRGLEAVSSIGSRRDVRHDSCKLRLARQIADSPIEPSMTESFVLDDIEYKLCRYHVTWDEALVFCSSHKAHLATLDTEEKTAFVVQAIASSNSASEDYWIGARKYYRGSWMWNSNRRKLSFERDLINDLAVSYPGYEASDVHCLTIDRSRHDIPIFIPRDCNQQRPFICQRDNERTVDSKIRLVAASRVGDQEFRLYSGRATWTEAVVQCRQEGLQIGEVKTIAEARTLAVLMLRNRPDGIESAWIGGYTRKDDSGTWRWLASGDRIEDNGMWRQNFTDSVGACLLLDRHVCESPVYVGTTCDRKRDVLCQKPPKKLVRKYPVAVIVDDCPYWIGFYPLAWPEAQRSCDSVNASLVVLDSPKTIAHMMTLMLENRAELRHIWTDGIRVRNAGHWQWHATGERIPDIGKSFVPWCPDDGYNSDENECLNLDRENLDTPIVYGLSCAERQPYVCQPHIGTCVLHATPMTESSSEEIPKTATGTTSPLYEDSPPLSLSKVTAPYPMPSDNYEAIQRAIDGDDNHLTNILQWKPDESSEEKNASNDNLRISEYLKPLSAFTLPSLPQFGIRVVSAAETAPSTRPTFDNKRKKTKNYPSTGSSFHGTTSSILTSTTTPALTTSKKLPADTYNKHSSKYPMKLPSNSSVKSNLSGLIEPTISSLPMISTPANLSSKTQSHSIVKPLHAVSKNFTPNSSTTSAAKIVATSYSVKPEDQSSLSTPDEEKSKKYTVKTTRDLSQPNSTRIATSTFTTKTPETTTKGKPTYSFRSNGGLSNEKDFKDTQPKHVVVESFPVNAARPNTTLMPRKRQKVRTTTTEPTPYDAVDADYYNYEAVDESSTGKTTTEEETSGTESNEYPDDYETATSGRPLTKKKTKQTSSSSIRKVHTTAKSYRRLKVPKVEKPTTEDIDEVNEETEENAEDSDEATSPINDKTIPIASELSKNLEAALVNMMKQSVERRKNESVDNAALLKSAGERETNVSGTETSTKVSKALKSMENWSLRPYYAFEGPMIVGLSEDSNLGGQVERTGEKGNGRVREFKFIGKTTNENSMMKKLETEKFIGNETRRRMKNPADSIGNRRPVGNLPGASLPGMPVIQPNDPNSLVQLGRYFKNKFTGLESDGRLNVERFASVDEKSLTVDGTRDERLGNEQRRYGSFGPNSRPRLRYRPRPREDETRRASHPVTWEKKRRPFQEYDSNYYEGRRLYPRGYDPYRSSVSRRMERINGDTLRDERERFGENVSNSEFYGYDERTRVVSPRTFPAPIRTTRSFHEDSAIRRGEPSRIEQFPDFRLSKLVKEVKIDLDQRLLRRYLEGFARQMSRKNSGREDDWKSTWRQLLGQMLTVLDRMNINVNGDLVKVRVGSDEREDNVEPSSHAGRRTLDWKSAPRKHRKDPVNAVKNSSNKVPKRINGNSTDGSNHRRVSPNSLANEDQSGVKDSRLLEGRTTDGYRLYAYRQSVTKSPEEDRRKVDRRGQSVLPEVDVLQTAKTSRDGGGSSRREEKTARPTVDHQFPPRQVGNGLQRGNWFQPKYASFNNSSILLASPPSMIPHLSTVYGYQPVMPQLHHRILFPGWTGIRIVDRINPVAEKSAVLKGEYLPRGTLSRIVGSEHKSEHFGSNTSDRNGKSTTSAPMMGNVQTSPRDSFDRKIGSRLENESGAENRNDQGWRRDGEDTGRKDYRDRAPSRFYSNERYPGYHNESDIRKIDNDRGDISEARSLGEEDVTDEETNPREDYEQMPVWSPAHHLTKALELSLLRKFGTSSSNSMRSKNLVARSAKNSETVRSENRERDGSARDRVMEDNFETLNEEPSIVSLRMTMDPEKKSSPRAFRQFHDSRITERKPRTVELRVSFTGMNETSSSVTQRIDSANGNSIEDRRHSPTNRTLSEFSTTNDRSRLRAAKRRSRGFVDKDRRRALMNRLGERNRDFHLARPRSYPRPRENETSSKDPRDKSASVVLSPRDRKSRTIAVGGKNFVGYVNSSKDHPFVKHHIATVVRSFEDENITGKEGDKWRRGGPRAKEFGIDWRGQAASLFTDLKENSDEFTLYIDLTLGRVGSKRKNRGRPRG